MVLNFLESCSTVSDEELDFAHHYKSFMMVSEKFSGTQAKVLSDTSWSSQGHTESMTGLLRKREKGRNRDTLMAEGNQIHLGIEAGNDFWNHPKESAHKVSSQLPVTPPHARCVKTI